MAGLGPSHEKGNLGGLRLTLALGRGTRNELTQRGTAYPRPLWARDPPLGSWRGMGKKKP